MKPFILFLLFTFSVVIALAQSGRETPVPSPTSTPENSMTTEVKKENQTCHEFVYEVEFLRLPRRDDFIKKINDYGRCGYRLEKIMRDALGGNETLEQMTFTGLVKKDEGHQYEYSWFITKSPGQAQSLANNLAEKGFYLKKMMSFTFGACSDEARKTESENKESGVLGRLANLTLGENAAFFLFERKVGSTKKNEYRVVDAFVHSTKDIKITEKKMQELVKDGFRPVELWYLGFLQYHFLVMEKDEDIKPEGEYIFHEKLYGVAKSFTKLAQEGYKLSLLGGFFAVLNRTRPESLKIKYESMMYDKDIKKRLPKVISEGGSYIGAGVEFYPASGCDHIKSQWYFTMPEQPNSSPKNEIKFLNFPNFLDDFVKEKGLKVDFNKDVSEDQMTEFKKEFSRKISQLVNEGYQVVNIDYFSGPTIMFERPKQ